MDILNYRMKVRDLDKPSKCYECKTDRYILYLLEETNKYLCLHCLSDSFDMITQLKDRGDFVPGKDSYL